MILLFCQDLICLRKNTWTKRNKLQLIIFMRSFSNLKTWWKPRYISIMIFSDLIKFSPKKTKCAFFCLFMFQILLLHYWKKYIYLLSLSRSISLYIKSAKEFWFMLSISGWAKEGWEKAQVHGGVCQRVLRRMERFKLISTCSCLHAVLHL